MKKVVVSSSGSPVIVSKWVLEKVESVHGSAWNASSQSRHYVPSFFVVKNWKRCLYETIENGQEYREKRTTIYRRHFGQHIGMDTEADELINVMHVVVKRGYVQTAYPRKAVREERFARL